jgi:hypothetical protein
LQAVIPTLLAAEPPTRSQLRTFASFAVVAVMRDEKVTAARTVPLGRAGSKPAH